MWRFVFNPSTNQPNQPTNQFNMEPINISLMLVWWLCKQRNNSSPANLHRHHSLPATTYGSFRKGKRRVTRLVVVVVVVFAVCWLPIQVNIWTLRSIQLLACAFMCGNPKINIKRVSHHSWRDEISLSICGIVLGTKKAPTTNISIILSIIIRHYCYYYYYYHNY